MSTKLEIVTRFAEEGDLPEMLHLFAKGMRSYQAYPYRLFWEWKHQLNPFGSSSILLGFHHQQLVGIRAFQRWIFYQNGLPFHAFRAVDTVTAPNYQGRGVFTTLTLDLIKRLQQTEPSAFIFNTPNKASRPGYLKMGWEILGRAPVVVRMVPLAGRLHAIEWSKLQQNLSSFSSIEKFKTRSSPWLEVPKSPAYLNWRYCQCPVPDYGLYIAEHRQECYYLFLKIRAHRSFRELRVCEVWSKGEKEWSFIAQTAARLAHRLGCATVSLLPEPGQRTSLLRFGYFSVQPFANVITLRDLSMGKTFAAIQSLKMWAFTMGDLELF